MHIQLQIVQFEKALKREPSASRADGRNHGRIERRLGRVVDRADGRAGQRRVDIRIGQVCYHRRPPLPSRLCPCRLLFHLFSSDLHRLEGVLWQLRQTLARQLVDVPLGTIRLYASRFGVGFVQRILRVYGALFVAVVVVMLYLVLGPGQRPALLVPTGQEAQQAQQDDAQRDGDANGSL